MATPFFRFGAFRLDSQARELFEDGRRVDLPLSTIDCLIHLIRHRDRPVGRDELAAAVWGRADVSEVSLSHAIMRLRRVLGDDGNAQRCIRTVPRLGYRWVMPLDEEDDEPAPAAPEETAQPATAATPAATPPRRRRGAVLGAGIAVVAVALLGLAGSAIWRSQRGAPVATESAQDSTLVLPVVVDAGEESAWLRLGLMDLIAMQLRRGGMATTPSETVLALIKARGADPARDEPRSAWRVQGEAHLAHGVWAMRLTAAGAARTVEIETHADDALKAARAAADELLIRLGRTPPSDEQGGAALAAATLRQRVNAAVLSGQIEVARRVIEQAPPALQASPEIALGRAQVAFSSGDYAASRDEAQRLLERLPADADADLRARALNTLASASMRQGRLDAAEPAFAEAAGLQDGVEPAVLAKAHMGLANVAAERLQLERAAADYGRARTLYELGNDPLGVALVDLNLAINAMQRGQPASALPLLENVHARFERYAAADALAASEIVMVEAELLLLDHAAALATSEPFVAAAAGANPRQRWQYTFARAAALVGAGRLGEADLLLSGLRDGSDAHADAIARALGESLAGEIALARGDPARAAELAGDAMTPALEARNREQYAQAGLLRVRAWQQGGDLPAAAAEIARLRAWNEAAPDAGIAVRLTLAEAEQSAAAGERDDALRRFADAMARATARAIPEEMVRVGLPYVRELLAAGRLDEAASVNGRIAPWAGRDMRAAWSEALVYSALGRAAAAATALERARSLAGERSVSEVISARH
ncbi:winged helix-turn-helix domain-containing protein [Dokdonella sp.]|uniref:winged helix-turn-helix domain-containing protein n=1 Tax=Dokdonella sp. TaxID=2291710 RepID=UPI001AFED036|nr:winged helix-turn-helix domain-containing protein [Dokdonella sp.]MBO9661823.1 winged helix-turn-helix domain-containing protein [Dokdonella sp.]